jgi:phospholipase C
MRSLKRSHFIAGLAGAAVLPYVEWVRPALAQAAPAKLSDIEHFVILMQENRSFDHYFGTLSGVRGYSDPTAGILHNGNTVFHQPDNENSAGYVLPFRLNTKTTNAQRLHDLSHSWNALHASWNRGMLDGFVSAHRATNDGSGPLTMGYYTRDDLPFYYALADSFTICDGHFCSVMGPTYPNRYFWMSATNDPNGMHGGPAIKNTPARFTWETYPERLDRAGVSWRIYHDEPEANEPVGLNVILNFAAFQDAKQRPTSSLYEYAVKTRGVDQMLNDMRTGNLPQVSWIIPPYVCCEHPDELPAAGENYVRQIVEALMSNPTTWAKTAFIINYDENDGLFDHVLPPTPPLGTPDEYINGQPTGLGFRVPALIVSPFTTGGYVCGDTFDHTSTLRLLETRFGVEVPNLSAWRRATCGDMTSAFGFGQPIDTSAPQFPQTGSDLVVIEKQILTLPPPSVPTVQTMPQQEAGTRKRRGKNVAFALR